MTANIVVAMHGWNAIFSLVVLVVLVGAICYALSILGFYIFMRSGPEGLPPLHGSICQRKNLLFEARDAGIAWFAKNDHLTIATVASAVAVWGFILAAVSGKATDFSSSGSLISILSLGVAFKGFIHAKGLFDLRHAIDDAAATRDRADTDERAEGLSRIWMAIIITAGTLIWGYGDRAFNAINGNLCKDGVSWVKLGCPTKDDPFPTSPQRFLVLFDWNSTAVQPAAEEIITEAALDARKDTNPSVCLVGHADASGSPKYNLGLSQDRANAVKAEMLKLGLNAAEVKVSFKGAGDLLVPSADTSREMLNRNVEILIDHGSTSTDCR